jgi:hypothetical protein
LEFEPRNESEDHGRLRAHLKGKRRKGDADRLDRLRQWRNECDYFDDLTFDLQAAIQGGLSEAEYLFSSLISPKSGGP